MHYLFIRRQLFVRQKFHLTVLKTSVCCCRPRTTAATWSTQIHQTAASSFTGPTRSVCQIGMTALTTKLSEKSKLILCSVKLLRVACKLVFEDCSRIPRLITVHRLMSKGTILTTLSRHLLTGCQRRAGLLSTQEECTQVQIYRQWFLII